MGTSGDRVYAVYNHLMVFITSLKSQDLAIFVLTDRQTDGQINHFTPWACTQDIYSHIFPQSYIELARLHEIIEPDEI